MTWTILLALEKTTVEEERNEADDNAQTIRPTRSPSGPTVPLPLAKAPSSNIAPIVEDYSDLLFDEDDDKLQEKVSDFKIKNSFRRGLFHPDDIKTVGLTPPSPGPKTAPLPDLSHRKSRPSLNPLGPSGSNTATPHHVRSSSTSHAGPSSGSFGRTEARRLASQPEFGKYAEEDDEDYDDIFGKPANGTSTLNFAHFVHPKLSDVCSFSFDADTAAEYATVKQVMGRSKMSTVQYRHSHLTSAWR